VFAGSSLMPGVPIRQTRSTSHNGLSIPSIFYAMKVVERLLYAYQATALLFCTFVPIRLAKVCKTAKASTIRLGRATIKPCVDPGETGRQILLRR
jgi:hypothetical protein